VKFLPGFAEGSCFVQDNAAQLAAELLDVQDGQKILDACAAPGGKTTHILELAPKAEVLALDNSAERLEKVKENLQRLKLTATCKVADAADLASWHAGELFDRVLLDVPCSATGVIRRHPDIKLLREAEDIAALTAVQANMLRQVWKTLKPGGKLLYATCSVLKAENLQQIEKFLQDEAGASLETINANWGHEQKVGRQVFPGEAGMDGFYYCLLSKRKDI
jgi:16S rRNA (cytosine967-C5)-methyltransferase